MSPNESSDGNQRLDTLRNAIRRSFPPEAFDGKVTPVDGEWTPELDDEQFLYEQLHGSKWTEVPNQFVYDHPNDFLLLTREALAVFIPAWLERALDNPAGENPVREYLSYGLSPDHEHGIQKISGLLRTLTADQQRVVRMLMEDFANHEPSAFIRAHAAKAVALIDRVLAS